MDVLHKYVHMEEIRMIRLTFSGFALAVSCCFFALLATAQVTDPTEVSALVAVKNRLLDPTKSLSDWNKADPCTSKWTGVSCFSAVGADGYFHVKMLQLLNRNLSGSFAPEIGKLSHLQILDFMWNELTGSIPKEIGNLASLKLLLLNGNKLSGSLPYELGNLANLKRLQVDENQISGPVPNSFIHLTNIKHLHLNNNSISGPIPSELSSLPNLLHLLLDNNNLSGFLPPEFSKLSQLRILQLDNNNFSGAGIPASYGELSKLVKISLRNCSLKGPVPDLSKIPELSYIDLSRNQLTGPIPSNKLSDNITTIDLSYNHLNGSIPGNFSNLPSLQKLSLCNNVLSGSLSTSIWKNKSSTSTARIILDFENNSLSSIFGILDPPANVNLRLQNNPVCRNTNSIDMIRYCGTETRQRELPNNLTDSSVTCPIHACPTDFEHVPASPLGCFCASPIRIGYRLKSPSFSFFGPYRNLFEMYVTTSLSLELYQLSIDSFSWEEGRLRMYLKLFPAAEHTFNSSEIMRIQEIFATWEFPSTHFFGPYELLNFTLLGPYSNLNPRAQSSSIRKGVLIAVVLTAVACAVATSATVAFFITKRHAIYHRKLSKKNLLSKTSIRIDGVRSFTFKELALATDNFSEMTQVGEGGYGKVYRGILSDDMIVAIKRATERSLQSEKEFLTEIELLSRLHHRNLVSLVGYCGEKGEQILVYEFMPNGTLRDWLSAKSKQTLDFGLRLHIALGSAKGILYLHTEAQPPVIHRDIKASNILLDSKFRAKVADFGLSRLVPVLNDDGSLPDHISTIVKGTPGYLDPEYFLTHKLTDKSDVYSLGVVFMEILTGMRPIMHGKNIVREVSMASKSGTTFAVIDRRTGYYPSECVERFVALALRCCQDKQEDRPSMIDVVRELENMLQMTPVVELDSLEPKSSCLSESGSSSSVTYSSKEAFISSDISGSNLTSGAIRTIPPR